MSEPTAQAPAKPRRAPALILLASLALLLVALRYHPHPIDAATTPLRVAHSPEPTPIPLEVSTPTPPSIGDQDPPVGVEAPVGFSETPPAGDPPESDPPPAGEPPAPSPVGDPAPNPAPEGSPAAAESEPPRIQVRDRDGKLVVTRLYARRDDQILVLLPDGRIAQVDSATFTELPFVPETRERVRDALLADPEFANSRFQSLLTNRYVVLYNGSEGFARDAANLLESMHDGLLKHFGDWRLPVRPAEFPLVAVIHETEAQFRARRDVEPEVQAYYEIVTNRIHFFEKPENARDNPELAAMRRPQTVAHEGAHQILHNIGLQPRLAPWPIWLTEGLAEYCAPTRVKKNAEWAGAGRVNPIHMATLRDLNDPFARVVNNNLPANARIDKPAGIPMVEYLVTRQQLNPTEYALAWALTHYLATRKTKEFAAYLAEMAKLEPLATVEPNAHLETFKTAIGYPAPNAPRRTLAQLDREIATHLGRQRGYEELPHYAVVIQHPDPPNAYARIGFVTQSPTVLQQRLREYQVRHNGNIIWRAVAKPTSAQARIEMERILRTP